MPAKRAGTATDPARRRQMAAYRGGPSAGTASRRGRAHPRNRARSEHARRGERGRATNRVHRPAEPGEAGRTVVGRRSEEPQGRRAYQATAREAVAGAGRSPSGDRPRADASQLERGSLHVRRGAPMDVQLAFHAQAQAKRKTTSTSVINLCRGRHSGQARPCTQRNRARSEHDRRGEGGHGDQMGPPAGRQPGGGCVASLSW